MINLPEVMTIKQLMSGLRISHPTAQRWLKRGLIKAEKLNVGGRRKWIIKRDDVINYLERLNK